MCMMLAYLSRREIVFVVLLDQPCDTTLRRNSSRCTLASLMSDSGSGVFPQIWKNCPLFEAVGAQLAGPVEVREACKTRTDYSWFEPNSKATETRHSRRTTP